MTAAPSTSLGAMTRIPSTSSRNDLFTTSWAPDVPPPKPLADVPALATISADTIKDSPKTSSFFDLSTSIATPPPPPNLASARASIAAPALATFASSSISPSPLSLSRASSLRTEIPPPLPLPLHLPEPSTPTGENDPLSPLHQSPSLTASTPALSSWQPPRPPSSDDVEIRLIPEHTYLLGEGRYAQVFLAACRGDRRGKRSPSSASGEINAAGDGYARGSWHLCAAKRMAADRESQTMGLREAFFLGRLTNSAPRRRAISPLRSSSSAPHGSVYVVKLIAVKEDTERRASTHGRSASDAAATPKTLTRQRSSTFNALDDEHGLFSFPSLPSLADAARDPPPQSLSRLVLLLEHAPLGTLDRVLRTSPDLVGRQLWERWARQGAEALDWVHSKGVVHCDVKPGNLLLTHNLDLRLSDFGSSLLIHPNHPPTDGVGLGTLPFSPPELVDPNQSFSFPVDIFAFGATLYQCITGREPFRGTRAIEMMHHVRKGRLWVCEETERLARIGSTSESTAGSPYPSAWRDREESGLRRAGSLRVPTSGHRPRLGRVSSAESLRASEDVVVSQSRDAPAGVKLWANWLSTDGQAQDPVTRLLAESDDDTPQASVSRQPSLRSGHSRQSSTSVSPTSPHTHNRAQSHDRAVELHLAELGVPYADGSPAMMFLDGRERVPEEIREVIRAMVFPAPEQRPTASELKRLWETLGVFKRDEAD